MRIICETLVDVVIATLLFVFACVSGHFLHEALTPDLDDFYSVWFAIGSLPFWFYAKWRRVIHFDWWDVVIFGPVMLLAIQLYLVNPAIGSSAMGFVYVGWGELRKRWLPRRPTFV